MRVSSSLAAARALAIGRSLGAAAAWPGGAVGDRVAVALEQFERPVRRRALERVAGAEAVGDRRREPGAGGRLEAVEVREAGGDELDRHEDVGAVAQAP